MHVRTSNAIAKPNCPASWSPDTVSRMSELEAPQTRGRQVSIAEPSLSFAQSLFQRSPDADTRWGLAVRYPWHVWVAILSAFVVVHCTLFSLVDNLVDMRVCIGYSPDPLFKIIPFDTRWFFVTRDIYFAMILGAAAAVFVQAVRGVHTPALRWVLALSFMSFIRMGTLLTLPLCRPTVAAFGPPPLASPQMLNLHFFAIPWRIFALNDMVFSGHTGLFLLLLLASGTWFGIARLGVKIFLALMIYGLLATRDHYTVDILLAFPCAFFADFLAVTILRRLNPKHARCLGG